MKRELIELKAAYEKLDLAHGTLTIQNEKVTQQYDSCKRDLDDAIEKLHITNKARHETEIKLEEEIEKCRNLKE